MKSVKILLGALLLVMAAASCSNVNGKLEKMIPRDAKGVVCIKVPEILEKAEIADNDYELPAALKKVVEANPKSQFCTILADLPNSGIDPKHNVYVFFTGKTYKMVTLVPIDDTDKAVAAIEKMTDNRFEDMAGVKYIGSGDTYYVMGDGVLLAGSLSRLVDAKTAVAEACRILDGEQPSIADNDDAKECLKGDGEVSAYFDMNGIGSVLNKSKTYRSLVQKMPLVTVFTESDIKAVVCDFKIDKTTADLTAKIKVGDHSDYVQLLSTTLGQPSNDFLKAIPNSMDCILSMSVNGQALARLPQMQQLTAAMAKMPGMKALDLAGIISTVNGPLAVGFAKDPYLQGEWNAVVAAKTANAQSVLGRIIDFANAMGQAPQKYGSEYIYQYNNKQVNVGVIGDVVYVKMLDYEQTEGYAYELPDVRDFFAANPIGIYVRAKAGNTSGILNFGITHFVDGKGFFYTEKDDDNAAQVLLGILCSIKGGDDQSADSADDDLDLNSITGAGDMMQSVD